MQSIFVFATELHTDRTRNGKEYVYFYDQSKTRWNLFSGEKVELNKGYVIDFEVEGQYQNVKAIKPVVNIFKQEALKEVASKNDIIRNLNVCLSYAKDLVVADKLPLSDIENQALTFYDFLTLEADKLMAQIQTPKPDIK